MRWLGLHSLCLALTKLRRLNYFRSSPCAIFQGDLEFGSMKRGHVCEILRGFKNEMKQCFQLLSTSQLQLHGALTGCKRSTPLPIWAPSSSCSNENGCTPSVLLQNKQEQSHGAENSMGGGAGMAESSPLSLISPGDCHIGFWDLGLE